MLYRLSQRFFFFGFVLVLGVVPASFAWSQDDEEDDEFRSGLIAQYRDEQDVSIQRLDRSIAFVWNDAVPDARLSAGKFSAQWHGYLMSQTPGKYQLHAYAVGQVQVKLNGKVLIDKKTDRPQWLDSKSIELPFDYHELEVHYRKTGRDARISLYWSGPQFQLEPLGPRQFSHDTEKTPNGDFQRGQLLSRALRCSACHDISGELPAADGPDLTRLAGNVQRAWLIDRLSSSSADKKANSKTVSRRMPHFGFSKQQSKQLAAYLLSGQPVEGDRPLPEGDAKAGEKSFLTLGCLACHRVGDLGDSGLFGGGDLSLVGGKRPADFFSQWLAEPQKINSKHRMPVFKLLSKERDNLAAYLSGLGKRQVAATTNDNATQIEQGQKLFAQHRCAACHEKKSDAPKQIVRRTKLDAGSSWDRACTGDSDLKKALPGYQLSAADQIAVKQYVTAVARADDSKRAVTDGRLLLIERNCLACHARDDSRGLAPKLPAVATTHGELASFLPAMTPPPLDSVGDKLYDEALADAIARKSKTHRPWLAVRMPKFNLSDSELHTLVKHLVDSDRIPDRPKSSREKPDKVRMQLAGARLVTTDGFGCTSCHQVGDVRPVKAPLNARGPDLSMLQKRIRHQWFDRWVRNPARIVPRMEMPSVQLAVRGVMDESIDDQLAAVWHVLNQPGFQPPEPNPVRVVRRTGFAEQKQRAAVLTDVLLHGKQTYVKPFVVGLPNRHSVLLDLETNRLAGWWIGDVARQRTKGKVWYWEAAGSDLFSSPREESEIAIQRDGKTLRPMVVRQFPTEVDAWKHDGKGGIQFHHRLLIPAGSPSETPSTLRIEQTVQPLPFDVKEGQSGFRRRITIRGAGKGDAVRFRVASRSAVVKMTSQAITLAGPGTTTIQLTGAQQFEATADEVFVVQSVTKENALVVFDVTYSTRLPVDRYVIPTIKIEPPKSVKLHVVPGYDAIRLPLADELMPTNLAWRSDGTLIVTSLKGRVWLARDTNGDGLEDDLQPFSDELAAPFGAAARENYIDVINKYALLRLYDDDGDGKADRTVTLASGWGHSTDYHDWAAGLPRDEKGNYYAAFPCQQDKRSPAAAHLRGKVVKLVPRKPTANDPRQFKIELLTAGHRFPIGIARRRDGELFVTDNQGHYNPFNELNHVVTGKRYGFLNLLERKPGFNPPLTPPAIDIPHPWTRSVNGICFLETPNAVKKKLGRDVFGPFEGHLIGCEYDTRRLIRMSLQRVGDTYQGAAYPFSFNEPTSGEPLLGPLACKVAPDGDLYIGSIRDSGWGAANNVGTLVRLRPDAKKLPPGIAEVRARNDGFEIDFTKAVDSLRAADVDNYTLSSYTRVSTPAYGGPDKDRRSEKIASVTVSADGRRATLKLDELREGYVYELHVKNLTKDATLFYPAEAHYTLRKKPK